MSLPNNATIYTIGSTTFVQEPTVLDVINAVSAKCVAAGRSDLLPVTLVNLEDVLVALGANVAPDKTLVIGSTTFITRSNFEQLLAVARSIGA